MAFTAKITIQSTLIGVGGEAPHHQLTSGFLCNTREPISERRQERIDFIAQGYYSENVYSSDLLWKLLCWGVSVASRHAGCPAT
jgi:hypothetical protein